MFYNGDNMNTEVRYIPIESFEVREDADGVPILEGMAMAFDKWSEDLGGFREKISKDAEIRFDEDVHAYWNHDSGQPIARQSNGTLILKRTASGIKARIKPNTNTTIGKDIVENTRSGLIKGMSFTFGDVRSADWKWDKKPAERVLKDFAVYEVSPVMRPAYKQTSFMEARSVYDTAKREYDDANKVNDVKRKHRARKLRLYELQSQSREVI